MSIFSSSRGLAHLSSQGCASKSSMLGDPCLVVAPLSLTPFLVFQFRTASRFFAANCRAFGKRLRRPFEFWGFRFGGARDTRVRDGGALCAGALRALSGNRGDGKGCRRSGRSPGIGPLKLWFATFRQESGLLGRRAG